LGAAAGGVVPVGVGTPRHGPDPTPAPENRTEVDQIAVRVYAAKQINAPALVEQPGAWRPVKSPSPSASGTLLAACPGGLPGCHPTTTRRSTQ
jgi:hypothetical protein